MEQVMELMDFIREMQTDLTDFRDHWIQSRVRMEKAMEENPNQVIVDASMEGTLHEQFQFFLESKRQQDAKLV